MKSLFTRLALLLIATLLSTGLVAQMTLEFNTNLALNSRIRLPLYGTVNVSINWGDGTSIETVTTAGLKLHNYASEGTYTVSISGTLTEYGNGIAYNTADKLVKVTSFGSLGLTSLNGAFYNAINLVEVPATLPATITNLSNTFNGASAFDQDISTWDVSNVTSVTDMFNGATLSTANYDALLIAWAALDLTNGLSFNGGNSTYTAASARQSIIDDDSWTITDGGIALIAPTGSGTSGDPYLVATLSDLYWITQNSTSWDKYFKQTADINASGSTSWNGGAGFTPIGNGVTKFTGNYKGQNHTIDGLFINRNIDYIGMFGFTNAANIENLGLTNVNISGNSYIGALVGYMANGSTVSKCYSSGTLASLYLYGNGIGGLTGNLNLGTISNSYSSVNITGNYGSSKGGFVGILSDGSINNCYATGEISGDNIYMGGFIGSTGSGCYVSGCYSTGNVSGKTNIGGFCGFIFTGANSIVNNCYSRGNVTRSSGTETSTIGGFIGEVQFYIGTMTIEYCYSTGSVSGIGWVPTNKGFLGYTQGVPTYTSNFFDSGTSLQSSGTGATATTTPLMKTQSTFTNAGWNFTSTWAMDGSTNNGYAYFQPLTATWNGSTNSDWGTAANWDGGVPVSTDNVIIASTSNNPVIGPTSVASCNNLSINASASLTIESDATGTGSLIVEGSSTGNVIFKRYLDEAGKAATWHYVSAPVVGQAINNDFMTNNSIYSPDGGTNFNFYRWDEDTDYWIAYGSTGDPEAFGDAVFADARGYAITKNGAGEISFTGTVRTADVSYAATYTAGKAEGHNLVGNPFTSAIGITNAATSTQNFIGTNTALLDDNYEAVFVWDEQAGYDGSQNDYKVISNAAIGGYTQISQDYIQPGQAFMVRVVPGGGMLAFNKNMQAHATVGYYKNSKETWPSVELIAKNAELFNSTSIGFNEYMSPGIDPSYDVGKMKGNPDIALYTRLAEDNGVDFAIQALPFAGIEEFEIPVGIDVLESVVLEFSINHDKLENYDINLEDRQENIFTDLRRESYFAEISGSGTGRFYLHFKDATAIGEITPQSNVSFRYAQGRIIINNPDHESGRVLLTNIAGQVVKRIDLNADMIQEFELQPQTGIYILSIQTNKGVLSKKIFIN